MSLDPLLWALKDSPTADTFERLILVTFAEKADSDGCNTFPSKATLAKAAMCDVKTVGRKIAQLRQRGLIAEGDQSAARHIPERYRPVVYDLQIPLSWFGHRIDRVNEERAQRGLPPLTERSRPDIAPAPARSRRSDFGRNRAEANEEKVDIRGDLKSPDSESPLDEEAPGGTQSPGRGDSQSVQGGLEDPQIAPINLPGNPPPGGGGADVRVQAAEGREATVRGNGKPSRPKAARKAGDGGARTTRSPQEAALDQFAQAGARAWWDHAQSQFGPWAGAKGGFVMLMGMIKRAAQADYTKEQIWAALLDCGKHVPSAQQWQDSLGRASGKVVQQGRRGAVPMYDDVASHPQHPTPQPTADELLNALDSR
ncbi:helix-turn-helix domain-containing protein [Kitasatospora sp. NPDC059327]|uniref:helix-turn-helix domain-containing protein n=1 Tax=Kitasatospora sp. NPDC059327 TaxID=3346803 RepID=UPI003693005E